MKDNNNNNNLNNIFVVLAVVLVAVALLNVGVTFVKISEFQKSLTGFATGYINLTVNTNVGVEISPAWGINWSNGSITSGFNNATLTTIMNTSNVSGGNWSSLGVSGILIVNTGNTNASLTINATKNNTDWFGAAATGPSNYSWNVSNMLAGSCNGGNPLNVWKDFNHTAVKHCAQFSYLSTRNKIWLDIKLQIPSDLADPNTALADTLTITAAAAG